MKRLELTRKGILQAFFDCSPLSCAAGAEDLHCAKLCGSGAFLCTLVAFFLFDSVRYAKPHPTAKQNQNFYCSPRLVMTLGNSDEPSLHQSAWGLQLHGFSGVLGQVLVLGHYQEPFGGSGFKAIASTLR